MNRHLRMRIGWFAVCLGMSSSLHAVAADCVDRSVAAALHAGFSDWRIVGIDDLRPEDRDIWNKWHKPACPGVAKGHYKNVADVAFAVSLFQTSPHMRQMLLLVERDAGKYKSTIVSEPKEVGVLAVVSAAPPGVYEDVDGAKHHLLHDAIDYEVLESGEELFYFKDGKFISIMKSD